MNLPGKINLSNPVHAEYYSQVAVTLTGKDGRVSLVKGSPIEFAVAIPKSSVNKELAKEFIRVLTSTGGERIIESCGLIPC